MTDLINRVYKTLPEGARAQMLLCDAVFLLYTFPEHLAEEDPIDLVRGKEIVMAAHQCGYAVRAFNINNLARLQGVAAEGVDMHAPLIIAKSEGAPHLYHGRDHTSIDQCIRGGLTSVMVDASPLPREETIKETGRVAEMVHAGGVSVEAELEPARDLVTQIVREKTQLFDCAGKAQEVRS
jgi:hypothetical protein